MERNGEYNCLESMNDVELKIYIMWIFLLVYFIFFLVFIFVYLRICYVVFISVLLKE